MTNNNLTNKTRYVENNLLEKIGQKNKRKNKNKGLVKKIGLTAAGLAAIGTFYAKGVPAISEYMDNKKQDYLNNIPTQEYTIKQGDTLWDIINKHSEYDSHNKWKVIDHIKNLNEIKSGNLQPGQEIDMPQYSEYE